MKPIKHIYIGLLLILASTVLHAKSEAIDGIYHVDINNKYPNLVKDSRDSDDSPVLPNFEPKNSKVLEIEKAFFFFLFSQTAGFEPHILDKSTGKVRLLIDTDGELEGIKRLFYNSTSFRVSSTHIIFQGNVKPSNKSTEGAEWYITDGTEAGTRIWNTDIFHFKSFRDIRKFSNDEVLINDGFNLYRFNEATQERVLITDLEGNALRMLTHSAGKYSLYGSYLTDGSDAKGIKLSELFVDRRVSNPRTKFDPNIYLNHNDNGVTYLAKITADEGLSNLLDIAIVPQCGSADVDLIGNVFEDNNYIYFRVGHQDNEESEIVHCLYRYDKSSKEFDVSSNSNFEVLSFSIVAIKNGKPILFVDQNWGDYKYYKYHNFAQVDIDAEKITFAAEKQWASIDKLSINDDYIYAYKSSVIDSNNNELFRLDFSSFESKVISRRIGVTDERPSINHHLSHSFIHDGNLHIFISLPYPALFKTNDDLTHLKPVSYTAIDNQTDGGTVNNIMPIDDGWLILAGNNFRPNRGNSFGNNFGSSNGSISHLSLTGQVTTIVSDLNVSPITKVFKNNRNAFISDQKWLYQIDLATLSTKKIYENSNTNLTYSDVVYINDQYAYLLKHFKPDFLYRLDLSDNTELEIADYFGGDIYQCGADEYLINSSADFHSGLHTVNDVFLLEEGKFKVVEFEGVASTNYRLQLEAIADGKILFVESNKVIVYDCNTKETSSVVHNSEVFRNFRELTWKNVYNKYDKVFYPTYSHRKIFSLSTGSQTSEFNTYYDGEVNFLQLFLTNNGVFIYSSVISNASENRYKLYTIDNKQLIEVENFDYDTKRYTPVPFKVTQDGRYIVGSYRLQKKQFSERDNKEQLVKVTGYEPYIFDTNLEKSSYLSLFPGVERGAADIGLSLNKRIMASGNLIIFSTTTFESKNELTVVDPICLLELQCSERFINRAPHVAFGETFYYESGNFVSIPFRASDSDLDDLRFSLINAPDWLSITDNGIIEGVIPDKADAVYAGIKVLVSDDESETESTAFNFYIDHEEAEESNVIIPPVPNIKPEKPSNSGEGGGSVGFLLLLVVFVNLSKKLNTMTTFLYARFK